MEKIDLTNYEAYFLDYAEGTLSAEEQHDLMLFLKEHPELKAEMEADFGIVELIPEKVTFDAKSELKVDENQLILTPDTVEDVMIAEVEGQLNKEEIDQLSAYVHAEKLEKTRAYYQATKLKADTSIVFEGKNRLKMKTGRVITLRPVMRAAGVAAMFALMATVWMNWDTGSGELVNKPGEKTVAEAGNPIDPSTPEVDPKEMDPSIATPLIPTEENNQMAVNKQSKNKEKEVEQEQRLKVLPDEINFADKESRDSIPTLKQKMLPIEHVPNTDDFADNEGGNGPERKLNPDKTIDPVLTEENDMASTIKREEPYRLITNAASEIVKRDISFSRDKDLETNNYVAYSFKLGKFEFERKKRR